jgi:molybdopterin/thiamine biosynthesis adenylyltransferase
MHPRLKDVAWRRNGAELRLTYGDREVLCLDDHDGMFELVLDLLRTGSRNPAELAFTAGAQLTMVERLIDILDLHRLLVDNDQTARFDAFDRQGDARSFFVPHATLQVTTHAMLERMRAAHVLLLGAHDINREVLAQLTGLGVGRLTVADLHSPTTIGGANRPGVARITEHTTHPAGVAARAPTTGRPVRVGGVREPVADAATLGRLLDRERPDILVADLCRAASADPWLNACCVERVLPFASVSYARAGALIYSVEPGRSACVGCVTNGAAATQDLAAVRAVFERPDTTHRIPPIAGLLASLVVLEVLRYVTGYEPPAYAGQPVRVDLTAGGVLHRLTWRRNRSCSVCRDIEVGVLDSGVHGQ